VELPPFILASASPRRAELLRQLQPEFQIIPTDADEIFDEQLSPLELCQLNAHRKSRAAAKKIPDALVLGADTLVFLEREVFGKPRNLEEAKQMLAKLQGRTHQVVTGVSLIHLRGHRERLFAVSTDVTFRPLTSGQIGDYLSKMNPLDKAGAYAIQEHGDLIISEIYGSFSNVVGLPIERVREELAAWGK
jgi:septum formation protein